MIRVLVADDHAVVRKGLIQIIGSALDIEVSGEAATGFEVLEQLRKHNFDVVVLDLSMPGPSGLDVIKQISSEHTSMPVLVLSMYPEDQYGVRVLRAGAAGYLTKESVPEQLVTAIRQVAGGRKYVSPVVAEALLYQLDRDEEGPLHARLSDREFEVMKMLAEGVTVSEIGEKLSLSVKTISTYRSRVLEKMNMKNNAELTHYAIKAGLIE